jgi:hypothetical protein
VDPDEPAVSTSEVGVSLLSRMTGVRVRRRCVLGGAELVRVAARCVEVAAPGSEPGPGQVHTLALRTMSNAEQTGEAQRPVTVIQNEDARSARRVAVRAELAAWITQEAHGCAVAPRTRIRRVRCSITASTYMRAPDRVTVSRKSHASRASAWERRKPAHVLVVRSGAGSMPASLRIFHGRRRHLHPEHEQFAVHAPVSPPGVLPD